VTRKLNRALTAVVLALVVGCNDTTSEPTQVRLQADRQDNTLRLVTAKSSSYNAETAVVDESGGVLIDGQNGHQLIIPRGAVSEPTLFVMGTAGSDKFAVKLKAYRLADMSSVKDFTNRPLQLRFNLTNALIGNTRNLRIVYVSNDLTDILEVLATSINKDFAEANLTHFSIYSMAID
jgi:hypothetical protein